MILAIRKIWAWIRAYWYVPMIILGIIVFLVISPGVSKSLLEILKKRQEMHQKEVDILEDAHEDEIKNRERALNKFHLAMEIIEERYEAEQKELDKKKKKEIEKILKDSDPDEITAKIAEVTGFEVVIPD
jgi:hypothetical protein